MAAPRFSQPLSKGDLVQVQDWCMQTLKQVEDFEKKARIYQLGARAQEPSDDLKRRVSMLCQPSSIEAADHWRDLAILHSLVVHFSVQGDEALRTFVFRHLYGSNAAHLDSLHRLTSLALTTNQTRVLEQVAPWIKFQDNAAAFTLLLMSDLSMLDATQNNVLVNLPKTSLMFTEAFILALTDTYCYDDAKSKAPSPEMLATILSWISAHPDVLVLPTSQHYEPQARPRFAAVGLLRWTAGQPWCGGSPEHAGVLAKLHFECLAFLRQRDNPNHTRGLWNSGQLTQIIARLDAAEAVDAEGGLELALDRITQFVLIAHAQGFFANDIDSLKQCLQKYAKHELISMLLRKIT